MPLVCGAAVESETPLKTVRTKPTQNKQAGEGFKGEEKEAAVFYQRPCGDVSSLGHEPELGLFHLLKVWATVWLLGRICLQHPCDELQRTRHLYLPELWLEIKWFWEETLFTDSTVTPGDLLAPDMGAVQELSTFSDDKYCSLIGMYYAFFLPCNPWH